MVAGTKSVLDTVPKPHLLKISTVKLSITLQRRMLERKIAVPKQYKHKELLRYPKFLNYASLGTGECVARSSGRRRFRD